MPRLFLCEKPSQARDIAKVLGVSQQQAGFLSSSEIVVTWAYGHLMEMAAPEDYDPELKHWSPATLPILPDPWVWKVRKEGAVQFKVIAKLLKQVNEIVIATDADREGEAIAREILEREHWQGPVFRLWLSALDDVSIQKALAKLIPGDQTQPLYAAAVARSKADWLVGMNLSRAYTLSARAAGLEGVMSVGRVQTPTLKLVVDRDRLIEHFKPIPFFSVLIQCQSAHGHFSAHWQAPETLADAEGRCLSQAHAEQVARRVQGQTACVIAAETSLKQRLPPLPLDCSTLQLEASKRFGFGAQHTLDLAQALYETHKATTYPRSDCAYLPISQHAEAPGVLQALKTQTAYLDCVNRADATLKSRAWNDQKVSAHHALIPTQALINPERLSADEQKLYDLIVRHYLVQFYPAYQYQQTVLRLAVQDDRFKASGQVTTNPGWSVILAADTADLKPPTGGQDPEDETALESPETALPLLRSGEKTLVSHAAVQQKTTQAPPRYTEGTLIQAMKNIGHLVDNPALKQRLKETSGIGTEATRAGIIQTLLKRGYIGAEKQGRTALISSAKARALIDALPLPVKDPVTTAVWEQALDDIAQGKREAAQFVLEQANTVTRLVREVTQQQPAAENFKAVAKATPGKRCPECEQGDMRRKQARQGPGKGKFFLACDRYPACRYAEPCN